MTRLAYSSATGYASVDGNGSVIEFLTGPCCALAGIIAYGTEHECQSTVAVTMSAKDSHSPMLAMPYRVTKRGNGTWVDVEMTTGTYGALYDAGIPMW